MKLAVIQHSRRETASEDSVALIGSIIQSRELGAEVVVLPHLPWLSAAETDAIVRAGTAPSDLPVATVLIAPSATGAPEKTARGVELELTPLGTTVALTGDECLDPLLARELAAAEPDAVILRPCSESDLQAEAVLERAIGFTEAASGLVLVAETDGGEMGEAGHGGSAIVVLGEVTAEAQSGDDLVVSDLTVPVPHPEARIPVPDLPPILAQRLAHHRGERVAVDYPADLT